MRILLDTNVIIDILQDRHPFSTDAKKILLSIAAREHEGFVTANQLTDIYYLMHHYIHDYSKVREAMRPLFSLLIILDITSLDCSNALASDITDYEDAVIVETATRNNIEMIITRNESDFKRGIIPACSPSAFLAGTQSIKDAA